MAIPRTALTAAALVLAAAFSPTVTAEAAAPGNDRAVGDWCLTNNLGTDEIVSKRCNSDDGGQHWEHHNYNTNRMTGMWRLVKAPDWCLANVLGTTKIQTKKCSEGDRGQQWHGLSDRHSKTMPMIHSNTTCLANNLGSAKILTKGCNYIDSSQQWKKHNGDMISLDV
ncbi:ricin-type beta-trefoil lectin domain protein [Streptomyces sp. NPDC017529]|uniref:ricin-type beta-trefoil lectin domain protein n=1 Tax=Streptomyces sp. NPDC017529 TaxID=3365000 RepID=UPI003795B7A5